MYDFAVCKGVEAHDIMQHFQQCHSGNLSLSAIFGVYVFALLRVCVCVRENVYVCGFRLVLLVLCLPVWVGETLHDPGTLGNKLFETKDLVPYLYSVAHCHNCDLTIV